MIMALQNKFRNLLNDKESKDILKAVTALFSVNFFASIVGVAVSLIQGRFVTAAELGFFKQFSIISNYAFFLHFGTFHAVERLYPLYMGKGEEGRAKKVVEVGSAWILIVCYGLSAIYVVLSLFNLTKGDWKSAVCWLVQIALAWTTLYGGFLSATFRSGKEFQRLAKASVWNPVIQLAIIPLYWFQPFAAMAARNCTALVTTIRQYHTRPVRVKPQFRFREWLLLIKEGLPLYTASYATTTGLDAIRGTLVLIFLSTEDWGYWSFAYTVILLVLQLPTSINAVYQPKIISEYAKNGSVKRTLRLARQPIFYGLTLMALVVPMGILAVIFVMPYILPNYVGATKLIIALLCAVPFKLSDVFVSILNAIHSVVMLNFISIICTVIQIVVALILAYLGMGIEAFGIGFCVGYIGRTVFMLILILSMVHNEKEIVK